MNADATPITAEDPLTETTALFPHAAATLVRDALTTDTFAVGYLTYADEEQQYLDLYLEDRENGSRVVAAWAAPLGFPCPNPVMALLGANGYTEAEGVLFPETTDEVRILLGLPKDTA